MPDLLMPYCCCPSQNVSACISSSEGLPEVLYLCGYYGGLVLVYHPDLDSWIGTTYGFNICGLRPPYFRLACEFRYDQYGFYAYLICPLSTGVNHEIVLGPGQVLSTDPLKIRFSFDEFCDAGYPCGMTYGGSFVVTDSWFNCSVPSCNLGTCRACMRLQGLENYNGGEEIVLYPSLEGITSQVFEGYNYFLYHWRYCFISSFVDNRVDRGYLSRNGCPMLTSDSLVTYAPHWHERISLRARLILPCGDIDPQNPSAFYQTFLYITAYCSDFGIQCIVLTYKLSSISANSAGCYDYTFTLEGYSANTNCSLSAGFPMSLTVRTVSTGELDSNPELCRNPSYVKDDCCPQKPHCAKLSPIELSGISSLANRATPYPYHQMPCDFREDTLQLQTRLSYIMGGFYLYPPYLFTGRTICCSGWWMSGSFYRAEGDCLLYKRWSAAVSAEIQIFNRVPEISVSCDAYSSPRSSEADLAVDFLSDKTVVAYVRASYGMETWIDYCYTWFGSDRKVADCSGIVSAIYSTTQSFCAGRDGITLSLNKNCQTLYTPNPGLNLPDSIELSLLPYSSSECEQRGYFAGSTPTDPPVRPYQQIFPYVERCQELDDQGLDHVLCYDSSKDKFYVLRGIPLLNPRFWQSKTFDTPTTVAGHPGIQRIELQYGPIGDRLGCWYYKLIPANDTQPPVLIEAYYVNCNPFQISGYTDGHLLQTRAAVGYDLVVDQQDDPDILSVALLDEPSTWRAADLLAAQLRFRFAGIGDSSCSLSIEPWLGREFTLVRIGPDLYASEVLSSDQFCFPEQSTGYYRWIGLLEENAFGMHLLSFTANHEPAHYLAGYAGSRNPGAWPIRLFKYLGIMHFQDWPEQILLDIQHDQSRLGACCTAPLAWPTYCVTTSRELCRQIYHGEFLGEGTTCYGEGCHECGSEMSYGQCQGFCDAYVLEILMHNPTGSCADFFHRPRSEGRGILYTRQAGTCTWQAVTADGTGWLTYLTAEQKFRVYFEKMGTPHEKVMAESPHQVDCEDLRIDLQVTELVFSGSDCPDGAPRIQRIRLWGRHFN